jgi:hypothetical protein
MGPGRAGELHGDRPDGPAGPVDDRGLSGGELAVIEQRLPGREPSLRNGGGLHVIDRRRLGRQVACLDGDELGRRPVPVAIDQPVDLITDGHARGAVAEGGDDAGKLMGRDDGRTIVARAVGPQRPLQLGGGEAGGVHLDESVADGGYRLRCLLVDDALDAFEADGRMDANGLHREISIAPAPLSHRVLSIGHCYDTTGRGNVTDGRG